MVDSLYVLMIDCLVVCCSLVLLLLLQWFRVLFVGFVGDFVVF